MSEMLSFRNVLASQQVRSRTRAETDSNLFPGHEQRMAGHMMQVRNHPCPCGSGARFVDCCLGKRRCKGCGKEYLPLDDGPGDCPFCGSSRTTCLPLREVCA